MAYAASNLQSNKNQLMVISLAMFGAIIAAIVVSTLLVMTLMRGEFANALNDVTTNAPTTQNVSAPSDFCTGTSTPQVSFVVFWLCLLHSHSFLTFFKLTLF